MNSSEWPEDDGEDALVARLVGLHERSERRARKTHLGGEYERVVSHFERRSELLRGERLATQQLVSRLFEGQEHLTPSRRVHREVEIQGAPGATAVGRLLVENRSERDEVFELLIGEPVSNGTGPQVRLSPRRQRLAPGATQWVRVEASLEGVPAGHTVTLPIVCRWETGSDRIWLAILASTKGRRGQ